MEGCAAENQRDLIARIQRGDRGAFDQFAAHHGNRVYAVAFARLRHRERAEDLVQEVFLRTWLYLTAPNEIRQPEHWLCRVTQNLAISHLRQDQCSSRLMKMVSLDGSEEPGMQPISVPDRRPTPRDLAEDQQDVDELAKALERLPAEDRDIVALHYMGGASHQDIADSLGTHRTTVTRRLERCIRILQTDLGKFQPGSGGGEVQPASLAGGKRSAGRASIGLRPQVLTGLSALIVSAAHLPPAAQAALRAASSDTVRFIPRTLLHLQPAQVAKGTILMSVANKAVVATVAVALILGGGYYYSNRPGGDPAAVRLAATPADATRPYQIGEEINLTIPTGQRHRLMPAPQPTVDARFAEYVPDYKQIDFVALPGGRLKVETIHRITGKFDATEVNATDVNIPQSAMATYQIWEETNRAYIHSCFVRKTDAGITVNVYTANRPELLPELKGLERQFDSGTISRTQLREAVRRVLERESMVPKDPDNRKLVLDLVYFGPQ